MRKSAQGFAHLVIILFVALILILIGVFWLRNRPAAVPSLPSPLSKLTPTTWQTYTNQNLHFKFDYSPELSTKTDTEEEYSKRNNGDPRKSFTGYVQYAPPKFLGGVSVLGSDNSFENSPFTVWVFDNPNSLGASAWFNEYWYYPFMWGQFNPPEKQPLAPKNEATVSGQVASYGVVSYQPGSPKYYLIPTSDKKMILIRILNTQNGFGDQLLATFKLTN